MPREKGSGCDASHLQVDQPRRRKCRLLPSRTASQRHAARQGDRRNEIPSRYAKIHHERGDQAKWLREVTSFQDQLRTTWERAVEEVVGPVLRRLSRKVDTTGLIRLTVLTDSDCNTMREAFGRCSALLHSQPGEINPPLPAPSVIETEIEMLAVDRRHPKPSGAGRVMLADEALTFCQAAFAE
jgi:hypothetical protein